MNTARPLAAFSSSGCGFCCCVCHAVLCFTYCLHVMWCMAKCRSRGAIGDSFPAAALSSASTECSMWDSQLGQQEKRPARRRHANRDSIPLFIFLFFHFFTTWEYLQCTSPFVSFPQSSCDCCWSFQPLLSLYTHLCVWVSDCGFLIVNLPYRHTIQILTPNLWPLWYSFC